MRMPKPLNTELPISRRIAKVVSEMTSMVAVPAYFEPLGLVPTTSYFDASVSVSARGAIATRIKANVTIVRIIVSLPQPTEILSSGPTDCQALPGPLRIRRKAKAAGIGAWHQGRPLLRQA